MSDEKIINIMRDSFKAMEKGDVEKGLSLWAEDGVWITPAGTFQGREELMRYLTWMAESTQDLEITETGNGIIVQGDKAFVEHIITGTFQGRRAAVLAMCAWEFSDGKIQCIRTVYDRLSAGRPPSKGWISAIVENVVAGQVRGGLGRYM